MDEGKGSFAGKNPWTTQVETSWKGKSPGPATVEEDPWASEWSGRTEQQKGMCTMSKGVVHARESGTIETQSQVRNHSDIRLRQEQQQEIQVVHHGPSGSAIHHSASVSRQSASSSVVTHHGDAEAQIQPTGKGTEPKGKLALPGITVDTSWQRGKLERVKLCSFLLRGKCDRGTQCGFAHCLNELAKPRWATVESDWPGWPNGKIPPTSVFRLYFQRHVVFKRTIPPEIDRLVEYLPEIRNPDREIWLRDPEGAVRPPGYKAPPPGAVTSGLLAPTSSPAPATPPVPPGLPAASSTGNVETGELQALQVTSTAAGACAASAS